MTPKKWIDENGLEIPANRVTTLEKKIERETARMLRDAEKASKQLADLKESVAAKCKDIWEESLKAAGLDDEAIEKKKGNHTIYNFDRTIKIETAISERIDFDDALMEAAKDQFYKQTQQTTSSDDELTQILVSNAFETSKGKLDPKKVLSLLQHRKRLSPKKYPFFYKGCELVEQAIRRPQSKTYFRIWKLDANGEYQNIDLNFSSL